jgi:hypothetical protein
MNLALCNVEAKKKSAFRDLFICMPFACAQEGLWQNKVLAETATWWIFHATGQMSYFKNAYLSVKLSLSHNSLKV